MTVPQLSGVLEIALYIEDLGLSKRFYENLLDLETLYADKRLRALNGASGSRFFQRKKQSDF